MNRTKLYLAKKNDTLAALYADRVNKRIRARYTLSEELSILRKRDTHPEAFAAFDAFAEECKAAARAEIYGEEVWK